MSVGIDSLEKDLDQLKSEYARMIEFAYKNRSSYDRLMFILSSENFYQAFKRFKYYQQYGQYRMSQASKIKENQRTLDNEIALLQAIKKSKEGLLKAKLREKGELDSEKSKKEL